MTDEETNGTDGPVAKLTKRHIRLLAFAMRSNPQRIAGLVRLIASELDTSTSSVTRAVAAAAGGSAGSLSWAGAANGAVTRALESGALVASDVVVSSGAVAGTGGLVGWFGGLTVGAKVVVLGATIGALAVTGRVAGWTDLEFVAETERDGYQAVGVYSDDSVRIVSVRSTEEIRAGIASCEFRHGGIDCEVEADVRPLLDDIFEDPAAATEALCGLLEGPRFSPTFADGWSAPYDGGSVTLDDWGGVDFAVCDSVTG